MKRNSVMSDVLQPLSDAPSQAYLTNAVQVADLLEWILQQVGISDIIQTSFSISEEFLRRLFFIKKEGNVRNLSLVLDFKASQKTVKLWPFVSQVFDKTYLSENHSKILLVRSLSGDKITVITSQNLTRGNRYESTFVTSDAKIFDTMFSQVDDLIKNHSFPLNELLE